MDNVKSYLMEWVIGFIKNRDVLAKRIKEIIKADNSDLRVIYNDGKETIFIMKPSIEDFEKIDEKESVCIITLNNKDNLDSVIRNWKKLSGYNLLNIYFINPFSKLDKKWILIPYTHNKICDPESLELGLKSMFELIEQISEDQLRIKLGQE